MQPAVKRFILLFATTGPLLAQSINGLVTNSATKNPVPNADVSLTCLKPIARSRTCRSDTTKTAEDGSFTFKVLAPYVYLVKAEGARGLVATRASQIEIDLDYRRWPPAAALKLEPESTLSGRVVDLENHPHPDVEVVAWRQFAAGSATRLKPLAQAVTDETGAYTFPHLIPGNYYVSTALVTTRQVSKLRDHPVEQFQLYAPSALNLEDAVATHVDMGQSYSGVDLKLRPISTHLIQGRAQTESSSGMSYDQVELHLDMRDHQGVIAPGREIKLEDEGHFHANVVPGNYILRLVGITNITNPKIPKEKPDTVLHLLAKQDLEVTGKDILNITLLIPPPFLINGHVSWEGLPDHKQDWGNVTLKPVDAEAAGGAQFAAVQTDGTFSISDCDAANYAVLYKPPSGTSVSAITYNGQDARTHLIDFASGSGGELRISLRPGASSATVTVPDTAGSAEVVLIPENWTPYDLVPVIHVANKDGRYSATGLPPGRYSAVAVPAMERSGWDSEGFVQEMRARGTPLDLAENDQKQVTAPPVSPDDMHQMELQLGLYH